MIRASERKYILSENVRSDGSRTIQFRHGTPFSIKKRITKRFIDEGSPATLYSDDRLEARVAEEGTMPGAAKMEKRRR